MNLSTPKCTANLPDKFVVLTDPVIDESQLQQGIRDPNHPAITTRKPVNLFIPATKDIEGKKNDDAILPFETAMNKLSEKELAKSANAGMIEKPVPEATKRIRTRSQSRESAKEKK